jgi:hypothetical protein
MGILHKLMVKLGRYKLIPDRRSGEDYLHRYYLFLKDRKYFPFNLTLHKILKSDDPIYHDHPWSYMTIILKGGYWEHTPVFDNNGQILTDLVQWRGPGSIVKRKAHEYHWLEMDPEVGPATTLFFMGPQERKWGFLINKTKSKTQWIEWDHYLTYYKEYHKRYIEPKIKAMTKKKD